MSLSTRIMKLFYVAVLFLAISTLSACRSEMVNDYYAADRTVEAMENYLEKYPDADRDEFPISAAIRNLEKFRIEELSKPLLEHAYSGDIAEINSLLEAGASPNVRGEIDNDLRHWKWTPLLYAAESGHEEVVQVLLAAGARVNYSSTADYTALMAAAENGHEEIVRTLLLEGAETDKRERFGDNTALMFASKNGYEEIVQALLAAGADEATTRWWAFSVHGSDRSVKISKRMTQTEVSAALGVLVGGVTDIQSSGMCPITIVHTYAAFEFDKNCRLWNIRWQIMPLESGRFLRIDGNARGIYFIGEP